MTGGRRGPGRDQQLPGVPSSAERERLREFYGSSDFRHRHDPRQAGNLYLSEARHAAIKDVLRRLCRETAARSYLEVGCGPGEELANVAEAGPDLERIIGVDLLLGQLSVMQSVRPGVAAACADGIALPFRDGAFDIVAQYMMLSSVPDGIRRSALGKEMLRVLRPGGRIVSLDLRYPRLPPRGRVAVGLRSLRAIFPGLGIESCTHVLLPPLARLLAPWSTPLCVLLARIAPLRIYRLAVLKRPA